MDGCGLLKLHALLTAEWDSRSCRILDGGDHGTISDRGGTIPLWQGYRRVKDSVVAIGPRPPKNSVYNQSVENALEQVEDTASLAVDFVDKKLSGLSSGAQRSPRHWQVPRALRYDPVILASPTLRERKKNPPPQ